MDVGFSGSQFGMSVFQRQTLHVVLGRVSGVGGRFHHGDCVGSDDESVTIARHLGFWIVRHPPIFSAKRAFTEFDEDRPPKPYLERNRDIVDETRFLIAAPAQALEQLRSGTWATIRYARKRRPGHVLIIPPSGLTLADVTNRIVAGLLEEFHPQHTGETHG
jgi:hypothetical protein